MSKLGRRGRCSTRQKKFMRPSTRDAGWYQIRQALDDAGLLDDRHFRAEHEHLKGAVDAGWDRCHTLGAVIDGWGRRQRPYKMAAVARRTKIFIAVIATHFFLFF